MWHFVVEVIDNNMKHSFDAQTNIEWVDVLDEVYSHFGMAHAEVQLVYHIGETGVMSYLVNRKDWDKARCQLRGRIRQHGHVPCQWK